jgi:hypothetical protein
LGRLLTRKNPKRPAAPRAAAAQRWGRPRVKIAPREQTDSDTHTSFQHASCQRINTVLFRRISGGKMKKSSSGHHINRLIKLKYFG